MHLSWTRLRISLYLTKRIIIVSPKILQKINFFSFFILFVSIRHILISFVSSPRRYIKLTYIFSHININQLLINYVVLLYIYSSFSFRFFTRTHWIHERCGSPTLSYIYIYHYLVNKYHYLVNKCIIQHIFNMILYT